MDKKQKKVFKIIIIALAVFLVAEVIYFGVRYYLNRQNSTFYTVVNSIVLDDENYIGAGFSDYRYSKFNDYQDGLNKATIFEGNNSGITNEIMLKLGYNSYYNDIVETKDGYIAVGQVEMTKEQKDDKLSEGLIVKYDKKFNIVWRKNVSFLSKTELYKVKLTKNEDIIIVGTSVYGEGYVGNHKTGGGILLKYSKDGKEKLRVNNGGPYNGRFNDVLIEKDGYVVVGLGKANSGIIMKYDLNGKKVWSSSYGYTDKNGIQAIEKQDKKYVTATTKVINPKDLSNYSAAIVVFDAKGKKIDDVKYTSNKITYFNDLEIDKKGNIIACGYTGKLNNNNLESDAIVVKYDKDLYEETSNILKGEKNDLYSNLYLEKDSIIALGYSNSKFKEYNTNGYDYSPVIKKYNSNLK